LQWLVWRGTRRCLLPDDAKGIVVVMNNCDQSNSFQIDGPDAKYLGEGDLHDMDYDHMEVISILTEYTNPEYAEVEGHCSYKMVSCATCRHHAAFCSKNHLPQSIVSFVFCVPLQHHAESIIIARSFLLVIVVCCVYDMFVQRRNEKLIGSAARTNAIVTSLFHSNIRDKLVRQAGEAFTGKSNNSGRLRAFTDGNQTESDG
jgi:hypothetical protein